MAPWSSKFKRLQSEARSLWDENAPWRPLPDSKVYRFAHFLVLVWRSFSKNRCPVRAAGLAYTTLLALVPMLAVVMGVTSSFLKKEGEQRIDHFVDRLVASVTPPGVLSSKTNGPVSVEPAQSNTNESAVTESTTNAPGTNAPANNGVAATASTTNAPPVSDAGVLRTRREIARRIDEFIRNTQSGTLGITGGVILIFAAIGMLSRIEDTMNDIWGVARGRGWFTRIVLYWGVLSLAPLLLVVAAGLANGPRLEGPRHLIESFPIVGTLTFKVLPLVVVCITFTLFYILMPNTKVRWRAAVVGGTIGGILFHLNNLISVLYVSRIVSNSKIYGSLGLVAVFMIGLYIAWLILLFGAQIAYAFQNRKTYMEQRQVESVNQRGREFIALRLMTNIGLRFLRGEPPQSVVEIGKELSVPTRLIQEIMHTLCSAQLVVETAGAEPAYVPSRPLERITCHDILLAMRASHGQELAARNEPCQNEVYGEFTRIEQAERQVAESVTMLALANRAMAKQLPNQVAS